MKKRIDYKTITRDTFLTLTKRQRRAFARRASYDALVYARYYKVSMELKTEVNKAMRELKRAHYGYGKVYNKAARWLKQNEYKSFRSPNQLKGDVEKIMLQNEELWDFLTSGVNTVDGAMQQEAYRINRLKELDILPSDFSHDYRDDEAFLRFLGEEETSAALDEFGRSDIFVEIAYEEYQKKGKAGLRALRRAYLEFMDRTNTIGFDEALERVGVKIEDYSKILKRW